MEYKNEKLGTSFVLPDKITVRQQLAFWEKVNANEEDAYAVRLWEAGKALVTDWKCETIPDPAASLDELFTAQQALVINWASSQIGAHIAKLDALPKNS